MTNIERVQDIYKAFGEGDVPGILTHLSDSVEWEYGVNSTDVPWLQPGRGAGHVVKFFESLAALEFHKFVVNHLVASGDLVIALIGFEATVKATGRRLVEDDEAHIWYFNGSGKAARFRHRVDTHQHQLAYKPA